LFFRSGDIVHVVEGKPPLMGNQQPAKMGQRNGGGSGGGGGLTSPTTPIVSTNGPPFTTRKTTVVRQENVSQKNSDQNISISVFVFVLKNTGTISVRVSGHGRKLANCREMPL
jgi:hypothetical protein